MSYHEMLHRTADTRRNIRNIQSNPSTSEEASLPQSSSGYYGEEKEKS